MTLVRVAWDYGGVTIGPWPAIVLATTTVDGEARHSVLAWDTGATPTEAGVDGLANTWEAHVATATTHRIEQVRPSNHGPWWYLAGGG